MTNLVSPIRNRILLMRRYRYIYERFAATPLDFGRQQRAFYLMYWSHAAREMGATLSDQGDGYLRITHNGRSTVVQSHRLNVDTYFNKGLMDEKRFVSQLVRDLGHVSPRFVTYSLRNVDPALRFLADIGGPCVVKPMYGSGGRGITTQVTNERRGLEASLSASGTLTLPWLMIEEQIPGDSYRLLYLDGELLHAVRRGKCTVEGDGSSSIKELVHQENVRRVESERVVSLSELTIDLDMRYTLADQGLTLRSVPPQGALVRVKNVANENAARDQECVTDQVHDSYTDLARGVFRRLGVHLIGIDVMSEDISRPAREVGAAINEINIPPGLHYHELVQHEDTLSSVGPSILRYLLQAQSEQLLDG